MAKQFTPPQPGEVFAYALENGYHIDPNDFIDFYASNDWCDSRGKKVINWKNKMRQNWFKNARKAEPIEGAPDGYGFWFVEEDGKFYFPTYWKNNKPYSDQGLVTDVILQQAYKNETNS